MKIITTTIEVSKLDVKWFKELAEGKRKSFTWSGKNTSDKNTFVEVKFITDNWSIFNE